MVRRGIKWKNELKVFYLYQNFKMSKLYILLDM